MNDPVRLHFNAYPAEVPEDLATRPTLVLLHGLFGSGDNLTTIAKDLAQDHLVFVPDARDHGRSPHTSHISYPAMAADVHALMRPLGDDITLVGHSMGGKTAMVLAQHWPQRVKQLVIIDISPREHANQHAHILDAMRTADLAPGRTRKDVEEHIQTRIKEPGVVQFIMKSLYWRTPEQLAWRMNVEGLQRDLPNILAAIGPEMVRVPTLFIRGGQSDYITREDIPQIKEQFPNSRIETIDYAGHWVHAQAPQEVVRLIREVA